MRTLKRSEKLGSAIAITSIIGNVVVLSLCIIFIVLEVEFCDERKIPIGLCNLHKLITA